MSPDATLTADQVNAAFLLAQGKSQQQVADKLKISKRTLQMWKANPGFETEVIRHREAWRAKVYSRGIADIAECVDVCNTMALKIRLLVQARANDPEIAQVPGGDTGLLAVKRKTIVVDADGNREETLEYKFDRSAIAELRSLQEHVARLMGTWQERVSIEHKETIEVFQGWDLSVYDTLSQQEFEQLRAISERLAAAQRVRSIGEAAGGEEVPPVLPGRGESPQGAVPEAL